MTTTRTANKKPAATVTTIVPTDNAPTKPETEVAVALAPVAAIPTVTGYSTDLTFYATRYKQGGRTVYALDLSLAEILALINKPDPEVPTIGNRRIRLNHAIDFGKYFREHEEWVSPAMLLRTAESYKFEVVSAEIPGREWGIVSFPRQSASDIHIVDGQHRILGMHLADQGITMDLDKAQSALATARRVDPKGAAVSAATKSVDKLKVQRSRMSKESVSIQIYVESDPKKYKQMFFDIAENQLGIAASVKARFDTRKVVNRALEAVLEHPLLLNRVDMDRDRVGRGSPYLMGAKHVAEAIKSVSVGLDGRVSRRQDLEWKEQDVAARASKFFDAITESFPPLKAVSISQIMPDDLRKTSLLGSVLMLRVLAAVYFELVEEHAFTDAMVKAYFAKLAPHMGWPVYPGAIWLTQMPDGSFADGAMAPTGRRQELKATKNALVDLAITKPEFLDEAPAPRPTPEPTEEDHPEYGIGYTGLGLEIPKLDGK